MTFLNCIQHHPTFPVRWEDERLDGDTSRISWLTDFLSDTPQSWWISEQLWSSTGASQGIGLSLHFVLCTLQTSSTSQFSVICRKSQMTHFGGLLHEGLTERRVWGHRRQIWWVVWKEPSTRQCDQDLGKGGWLQEQTDIYLNMKAEELLLVILLWVLSSLWQYAGEAELQPEKQGNSWWRRLALLPGQFWWCLGKKDNLSHPLHDLLVRENIAYSATDSFSSAVALNSTRGLLYHQQSPCTTVHHCPATLLCIKACSLNKIIRHLFA